MMLDIEDGTEDEHAPSPPGTRHLRRTRMVKRLSRGELAIGALLWPERNFWRPSRRIECGHVVRPCPHVSCRYHLYLDVSPLSGNIRLNFPELEPWEMPRSCALDVAESGEHTLEEVGALLNVTRERIRQIESVARQKLASRSDTRSLFELFAFVQPDGIGDVDLRDTDL